METNAFLFFILEFSTCSFSRKRRRRRGEEMKLFSCSARDERKNDSYLVDPASIICLSQRLSHACLSISNLILWNCRWLIKSVIIYLMITYYLDNRSNSRANTCVKSWLSGRDVFIRYKTNAGGQLSGLRWIIITVRIAWLHAGDSSFKFLPYQLSTVV